MEFGHAAVHTSGTKYEALGVTGVGNFLYGDEQGPRCRRKDLRAKYDAEVR